MGTDLSNMDFDYVKSIIIGTKDDTGIQLDVKIEEMMDARYSVNVKPGTDYSIEIFNSTISDFSTQVKLDFRIVANSRSIYLYGASNFCTLFVKFQVNLCTSDATVASPYIIEPLNPKFEPDVTDDDTRLRD
jgi:hypothetical protein